MLNARYVYERNDTIVVPHPLELSTYDIGDDSCGENAKIHFIAEGKELVLFTVSQNLTLHNLSIKTNLSTTALVGKIILLQALQYQLRKHVRVTFCTFQLSQETNMIYLFDTIKTGHSKYLEIDIMHTTINSTKNLALTPPTMTSEQETRSKVQNNLESFLKFHMRNCTLHSLYGAIIHARGIKSDISLESCLVVKSYFNLMASSDSHINYQMNWYFNSGVYHSITDYPPTISKDKGNKSAEFEKEDFEFEIVNNSGDDTRSWMEQCHFIDSHLQLLLFNETTEISNCVFKGSSVLLSGSP